MHTPIVDYCVGRVTWQRLTHEIGFPHEHPVYWSRERVAPGYVAQQILEFAETLGWERSNGWATPGDLRDELREAVDWVGARCANL
jgi:hypothetical protein